LGKSNEPFQIILQAGANTGCEGAMFGLSMRGSGTAPLRHVQNPNGCWSFFGSFAIADIPASRSIGQKGSFPTFAAFAHEFNVKPEGQRRLCGQINL
jgi:hypothetical protein